MSGDVEAGSPRPRPLSGGFWTLLSWLRREEHSSNDSLSSAGSDRTAVSFSFLTPAHYHSRPPPLILPPPGPPTDTYKKRVRERNLRRQYDRDTTLHRKYGLFRGEGISGYETIGLPPTRRGNSAGGERAERERRAASECFPRRAAHVPGKRRAPPPPALRPNLTLPRRHTRKRPAPQPPTKSKQISKENIFHCAQSSNANQMNSPAACNVREVKSHDVSLEAECKSEKYTKKDNRDTKIKSEKSFLKQIFENKKRNSAVDITTVKVLPSISELDKQAAEIIENKKLKYAVEGNRQKADASKDSVTICPKCLKDFCFCNKTNVLPSGSKDVYNRNALTIYTQTDRDLHTAVGKKNTKEEEKQKLKEMLKEMKDSLPKRPKHDVQVENIQPNTNVFANMPEGEVNVTDTPTLRIGSSRVLKEAKTAGSPSGAFTKDSKILQINKIDLPNTINITQHVDPLITKKNKVDSATNSNNTLGPAEDALTNKHPDNISHENKKLHTPLKISSLLNPIYVPRNMTSQQNLPKTLVLEAKSDDKQTSIHPDPIYVKTADTVRDIILNSGITGNHLPVSSSNLLNKSVKIPPEKLNNPCRNEQPLSKEVPKNELKTQNNVNTPDKSVTHVKRLTDHSRRRDLVNQLEQSIAKGDERAAAEAATKLAQLRLSCSVLSFSSQILGAPSTSSAIEKSPTQNKDVKYKNEKAPNKYKETSPAAVRKQVESPKTSKSDQTPGGKDLDIKINKKGASTQIDKSKEIASPVCASTSKEINENKTVDNITSINVWIEDKEKARGPIQLHVRREANVGDLRRQAEQSLGLPAQLQRWIVGRALCTDDNIQLISLAGSTFNAPFYLCLVESDTKKTEVILENPKETKKEEVTKSGDVYSELVNLERQALVPNTDIFECEICMDGCDPGDGVVLRECVHSFCRGCLSDVIRHCEEPTVSCPATNCPGELHEREIRALVTAEEYQRWLARGLAAAESGTRNAFHCRTRDCTGWALCEIDVRRFPCPVCKHTNCVQCQAIHENETCEQYQAKLLEATATSAASKTDEGTQALIDSLISRGEALQCPECSAVITKKWGCDWVKCSACKTEICWVTRGRRWGPGGRGDTSGGCRCGVDGKRCHPSCAYCH